MDKYQAEKIVRDYGGAIANDTNVFKKQSSLPCSKASSLNFVLGYGVKVKKVTPSRGLNAKTRDGHSEMV